MRVPILLLVMLVAACGGDDGEERNGRFFGYVRDADERRLVVDRAEFLTGADAIEANGGEPPPNDYLIRNGEEDFEALPVADDVRVTRVTCPDSCRDGVPGDYDRFAASFDEPAPQTLADEYRGSQSQYWITVRDGEVVEIDEQYLP